jgi:antitoxin Phd
MTIDANTVVSMEEANQDFSKVTSIVDQYGRAVVLKDGVPCYLVIQFAIAGEVEDAAEEETLASAARMMDLYDEAFQELAR